MHTLQLPNSWDSPASTSGDLLRLSGPTIRHDTGSFGTVMFVNVPEDEIWLWRNPTILGEVLRGFNQAAAGNVEQVSYQEHLSADGE